MIHKIERLVSIGKYRNYQAAGQVNFHKMTLIYGDNGGGKTTLTSVFRSLLNNDSGIIRSRISTNHTNNQAAQIVYRNGTDTHHTYNHTTGWSAPLNNIEIFDIHFVNDNVYSGSAITDDHRKQLHQFVIGAQGIAIQQQIEQNKIAKTQSRNLQVEYNTQLINAVGNGINNALLSTFVTIPAAQAENIAPRIVTAQTALVNANANAIIRTLQTLAPLTRMQTGINFVSLVTDLQTNIQAIQETILQSLFNDHCQELADNTLQNPEHWLRDGFNYTKAKQDSHGNIGSVECPFCKQEITPTLDILRAYTLRFNEEFNALVARLQAHLHTIRAFNLDANIITFNNINTSNAARIASWTAHLPNVAVPVYNIANDEAIFRQYLQSLIVTVEQKIQNPSLTANINSATEFQNTGQAVNANIVAYNNSVALYNTAIAAFLGGIKTVDQAQAELNELKRVEKRFEAAVVTLCNNLTAEAQNLKALETQHRTLATQQEAYTATFFSSYKDRINYYLDTVFKTLFKIDDVKHVPPRGQALIGKLGYKLTIDGKDISFEAGQPFHTKECLSEGDKSTIALAFFLSKLDLDTNRANKILIFDDPLSSLDTKRRTYTVNIIRKLFGELKQVVVLSHNEYFLHELSRNIALQEIKTLRIAEDFAAKASHLEVCNLGELARSEYFKQIDELERFRTTPNLLLKDSVFGWLRTVLEAHLRFKFYSHLKTMPGDKTFGRLIDYLSNSGAIFSDNTHRNDILDKLRMINNVSWMSHHGTPMPEFNTLGYDPSSITLPELDNLIVDTLDLINTKL